MHNWKDIELEGRSVVLTYLNQSHCEALFQVAQTENIWRYLPSPMPNNIQSMQQIITDALKQAENNTSAPFAIIHRQLNCAIGSTRYWDIQPQNKTLEIGWTWISPNYQRTEINTECKYLLLSYAFETLGYQRVQFKADRRNIISQKAIERLGAQKEGVLRKNVICWDGITRDTVYYSVLADEWSCVKERLQQLMRKYVN